MARLVAQTADLEPGLTAAGSLKISSPKQSGISVTLEEPSHAADAGMEGCPRDGRKCAAYHCGRQTNVQKKGRWGRGGVDDRG
jgi:hypothetical protein